MALTADEYLARDDPRRTELIDGVIIEHQRTVLHQIVCGEFLVALMRWTRAPHGHGTAIMPLNVPIDAFNVFAPDVLWFDAAIPYDGDRVRIPELAVEVRGPDTWAYDIGRKLDMYRQRVRELWLVDTASRSVLVYRGDEAYEFFDRDALASPLLPGFEARVGELIPPMDAAAGQP